MWLTTVPAACTAGPFALSVGPPTNAGVRRGSDWAPARRRGAPRQVGRDYGTLARCERPGSVGREGIGRAPQAAGSVRQALRMLDRRQWPLRSDRFQSAVDDAAPEIGRPAARRSAGATPVDDLVVYGWRRMLVLSRLVVGLALSAGGVLW